MPENPVENIESYLNAGGGKAIIKALTMSREQIISEITRSGLRGRGGAGFPTGLKWATVAHDPCSVKYFVCNAAEGEPGTFKDRMLIRMNPYQLLEGIAIGAYAVGAQNAYIVMKTSFEKEYTALSLALDAMAEHHLLGEISIVITRGPEDYLLGEEKAMLEVIEGGLAMPREAEYPPYVKGLFVTNPWELNPAVVNNVETLSNIPNIITRGTEWFRRIGTTDSPGTMIFTLSGNVRKPGVYELPMGSTLRELIFDCGGGLFPKKKIKAIFSGVSNAVILPYSLDVQLGFDTVRAIGSGLGSGGFVVFDDTTCMVQAAYTFSNFLWMESCNQCSACKRGTDISTINLRKLINGEGGPETIEGIRQGAVLAPQGNRCFLPVEHQQIILSIIREFAEEFTLHSERGCETCHKVVLPKIFDLDTHNHLFTYSEGRSQP
ncbi:MAG: NADH-ubiquinone oxidoreductase-F iron-sulfur binding region domain-containing protein [Bacteroidota bacterium]|nr:NADH-ubiquinone oxidoreductase-F iron-sulfur binding region domain-containing protein [Bacteroidota bacterium]MDP4229888.1 NADH-ubiquinone oxidoreductase-F iron-sulfur binding region domain-containing protein [Bacteroidota bacterium]MDP4237221.1 NADH-ubiquinone oxidoreductase-F iron-sulfur binding region domain-containing protein [Bacteroidota bacterium]